VLLVLVFTSPCKTKCPCRKQSKIQLIWTEYWQSEMTGNIQPTYRAGQIIWLSTMSAWTSKVLMEMVMSGLNAFIKVFQEKHVMRSVETEIFTADLRITYLYIRILYAACKKCQISCVLILWIVSAASFKTDIFRKLTIPQRWHQNSLMMAPWECRNM
jgi:hypothetical protein